MRVLSGAVRFLTLSGLGVLCLPAHAPAQGKGSRHLEAVYIETPITLDGELDEEPWQTAQPATDFIQNDPQMGEPATERTEVRVLYDQKNLYIGAYCFDSSGRRDLVLTDVRRDYGPRENDHFSILFDTFDDDRNAFIFGTNPGGAKRDGQVGGDGSDVNFDWDAVWHVKTRITDFGWQVEIAIPFSTFRFKEGRNQVWGINFSRRIRRKNEATFWSVMPRPNTLSRVSFAGTLDNIGGARRGRNLSLKPYVSAPLVRKPGDDVDLVPEAGLDLKYAVTPGLTLDLTVNTDFAQVEADEQQINLTRFSLFFPEKREFFLENSSVFEFGKSQRQFGNASARDIIPFFSRRIGISQAQLIPILGGARLSGRAGPYAVGFVSLQTDQFEDTPSTNFTVVRLRRDLFRSSDIGGIFVNKRSSGGETNRTYGADLHLKLFKFLDIVPFFLKSESEGLQGKDTAANFSAVWNDRFLEILGEYSTIGENFNPEVGFVPRKGIRKTRGKFGLKPRPGERIPWIRQFEPRVEASYITDPHNLLETRTWEGSFEVLFENNSTIQIGDLSRFERLDEPFEIRKDQVIDTGDYHFNELFASYTGDRSRLFSGNAEIRSGSFFDGSKDSYTLGGRVSPSYHFEGDLSWSHDDIELPSGDFSTNLVTARLLYSFSTRVFLNSLIQYNSTLKEVSTNIRFNFIHRPLSDLFLVYNERRSSTGAVLERALVGKLTYLFEF